MSSAHYAYDVRIFHKQARTLASAGFDVRLIAWSGGGDGDYGIDIVSLGDRSTRWKRLLSIGRVVREALRVPADVYHFHDPELLPAGLFVKKWTGKPVIYDVHEYYSDSILHRGWIPRVLRRTISSLFWRFERFAARRLDGVVTVNDHMNGQFLEVNSNSVAVCNFPQMSFVPEEGAKPPIDSRLRLGFFGVLSKSRGLDVMLETMQLLAEKGQAPELWLVGPIDWQGSRFENVANRDEWLQGLGVMTTGLRPYEEVSSYMTQCDILWCPLQDTGNYQKAIPTKLIEYMAMGKPVVATSISQTRRIIEHADCGILVSPDDPQDHLNAINRLIAEPELRRRFGENGRTAFKAHYSWESQGRILVDFYSRILGAESLTSVPAV